MISRVQEVTCQLSSANRENQNQHFHLGDSRTYFEHHSKLMRKDKILKSKLLPKDKFFCTVLIYLQ